MLDCAPLGSRRARARFEREVELTSRLQHPHLVENFGKIGLDVVADPPDVFANVIRTDTAKWAKVIKDAGIKGE